MDLSIVIPSRNAAAIMREQIVALQSQTFRGQYEIIIADNGSTDDTIQVVRSLAREKSSPPIVLVDASKIVGAGFARNAGAAAARSEFLAFCDADDVVDPGWAQAIYDALQHHEFVTGASRYSTINPQWAIKAYPHLSPEKDPTLPPTPWLPFAGGANLGIRKSVLQKVGGFCEDLGAHEDTDLSWRLALEGVPLVLVKDAVTNYRLRQTVKGIFDQARHYGTWFVPLSRRFRPQGFPDMLPSRKRIVKALVLLMVGIPTKLASKAQMGRWAHEFGWNCGLLAGHQKFRSIAVCCLALANAVYTLRSFGSEMFTDT